ncbi:hypothetical protein HanIR_Chr02g0082521 [Helianthus annuus]|nr:hypothetical protein HanIR_Chr02g0082521 [Helianthus annuus]
MVGGAFLGVFGQFFLKKTPHYGRCGDVFKVSWLKQKRRVLTPGESINASHPSHLLTSLWVVFHAPNDQTYTTWHGRYCFTLD